MLHSHPDGWPLHPGTKAMTDRQTGRDEVTDQPAIPNTRLWMCDCHWTSALLLYWKPKGDYLISVSTSSTPPSPNKSKHTLQFTGCMKGGGGSCCYLQPPLLLTCRCHSYPNKPELTTSGLYCGQLLLTGMSSTSEDSGWTLTGHAH